MLYAQAQTEKTATGEAQTEIAETGEVDYVEIVGENFEESDKETEILNQKNGWSLSGQSYQAKVGTGLEEQEIR